MLKVKNMYVLYKRTRTHMCDLKPLSMIELIEELKRDNEVGMVVNKSRDHPYLHDQTLNHEYCKGDIKNIVRR